MSSVFDVVVFFGKINVECRVAVTFKYQKKVVHHQLDVAMKISSTSGSMVKCKTTPKHFKFLQKISSEFLPTLRLFVTELINNSNYLGTI